jgi:hypothetical protein
MTSMAGHEARGTGDFEGRTNIRLLLACISSLCLPGVGMPDALAVGSDGTPPR